MGTTTAVPISNAWTTSETMNVRVRIGLLREAREREPDARGARPGSRRRPWDSRVASEARRRATYLRSTPRRRDSSAPRDDERRSVEREDVENRVRDRVVDHR